MAGNSQRRGARRGTGSKKGAVVGSGGVSAGAAWRAAARRRRPSRARATRPQRRAAAAAKNAARKPARARGETPELLVGRNPVVEALRAQIPTTALYVAQGIEPDERVAEAVRRAADRGVPVLEVGRAELDRMTGGVLHQGIGLQVPPYSYAHLDDVLARATESPDPALLVALDGVTDPRNLGAVVRSAAAFGAHGRDRARAAVDPDDRDRLADQRRRGRPAADRPGDQPGPRAQGGPAGRAGGGRAGRRRRRARWTTWRRRSTRCCWWSAPRAAGCPGWSARPATCGCRSR